ncbi:MAG: hypothetical protein LCI00_15920 [Chloroflexi bacterium]|nr:hypothetical protein [Chloroflexota bacterium]MCC6892718.1 hypothetical protein [Anaerolineae bacterium]
MALTCIERVEKVLDQWKKEGVISQRLANQAVIQFKDTLFGTGRFTNIIEIIGPNIKITVRMFAGLEGDSHSLQAAYAYLLNLPAIDATVTIQRDIESGNVGASVTFPCVANLHQLEDSMGHHVNTLTTYLEARYDRIVLELLELGVTFKRGD